MMDHAELLSLIREHGLLLLAPLAVVEGPIVSILGGYLAGRDLLNLWGLFTTIVIADLLGDVLLYAAGARGGRLLPGPWRERLIKGKPELQARLRREIDDHGTRLLILGKLTHGMGFAVLLAAGAARFPFWRFVLANLVATLIKSSALIALGWWMGDQWAHAEVWFDRVMVLVVVAALIALGLWLHRARRQTA